MSVRLAKDGETVIVLSCVEGQPDLAIDARLEVHPGEELDDIPYDVLADLVDRGTVEVELADIAQTVRSSRRRRRVASR